MTGDEKIVKSMMECIQHLEARNKALAVENDILRSDLQEWVMDFLNQSCGKWDREKEEYSYDHMCLSTYESALRLAIEQGWIKAHQLERGL